MDEVRDTTQRAHDQTVRSRMLWLCLATRIERSGGCLVSSRTRRLGYSQVFTSHLCISPFSLSFRSSGGGGELGSSAMSEHHANLPPYKKPVRLFNPFLPRLFIRQHQQPLLATPKNPQKHLLHHSLIHAAQLIHGKRSD